MSRYGLMSYDDDPERFVFRVVFLLENDPDDELDNPRWWVEGIEPDRPVRMYKVGTEPPLQRPAEDGAIEVVLAPGLGEALALSPDIEVVETVVVQPGEKTWEPPQELVDAMARLAAQRAES